MTLPIMKTDKNASKIHELFRKSKDWIYTDNWFSVAPDRVSTN